MNTALMVIDVQKDYFPGGRRELHNSLEASQGIKGLISFFRNHSLPVIHIRHISLRPGAAFFLPDTPGVAFHENVEPEGGEKVIVKYYPNSFRGTDLQEHLQKEGIRRLVMAGMMTHMCVDSTVRAAFDLGYECLLAGDCCATRSLRIDDRDLSAEAVQDAFLAALNGIFCRVIRGEDVKDFLTLPNG